MDSQVRKALNYLIAVRSIRRQESKAVQREIVPFIFHHKNQDDYAHRLGRLTDRDFFMVKNGVDEGTGPSLFCGIEEKAYFIE